MLLPNIWGAGEIFAFSGLDGKTSYTNDLVATLLGDKISLLFHLKRRRELFFNLSPRIRDIKYQCVASDIILVDLMDRYTKAHYPLSIIFVSRNALLGETSKYALPQVILENGESEHPEDNVWIQSSKGEYTALVTSYVDNSIKFAFSYSPDSKESALKIAIDTLKLNTEDEKKKKLGFFEQLPKFPGHSELMERTFYKCFSVLKANVMGREGEIKGLWTTPDRVPHRNMWLWDSVFHSFGLKYISPQLAYRAIEAVLEAQRDDGFIPHMITPFGTSDITQPPLLAWGIWEIFQIIKKRKILEKSYPRLKRYIKWNLEHRDSNKNYLCEWHIGENILSRCGESGMDNSPRFDKALCMDAVDFSSFMANEAKYLEKMTEVLNYHEDKVLWHNLRKRIKENVNKLLWDEKTKFYYDRDIFGNLNRVKTVASFTPMFSGIAEPDQAKALVEHLLSDEEFNTEFPVPSVARSEPTYSQDMWRGATWVNYNYMVMLGLKRYGYDEIARRIAEKTLKWIAFWYKEEGAIFEYFDSTGRRKPAFLERKGPCTPPYDIRRKIFPIKDYGWTAAIFIAITMEERLME